MTTLTLPIPDETDKALDDLAKATGRSKAELALVAIDEYTRPNTWQVEAIRAGLADADAGRVVDHEQVKRRWQAG
ncbi:CopG family ribbon-helix-helix protein [uncultured Thiohalocapsa sp.]|jgi:predicted transcriptional regulator|uniref:CopG family ribbon-helix-helix protein n=1 Tax=uncultured Thiohalocapsa sp. TaxID=768990 RepID=UPI0025D3C4E5|nr:ribbon-helix-helix protein, CopG family [uncultured Thiohalocapsa sp.]